MKKIKIFLYIIFISSTQQINPDSYLHNYLLEPVLLNRAGFIYKYRDNLKPSEQNLPVKQQTVSLLGEYQFQNFYSIYLEVPYNFQESEGRGKIQFWDHIKFINKFYLNHYRWDFYGGLSVELPRNHNIAGDVPSDVGYLEPYLGIGYRFNKIHTKFTLTWNTQYNQKFKEEVNQEFIRKWTGNLSAGYLFSSYPVKVWLESQYQYIYDPATQKKEFQIYGLGISYKIKSFLISIGYFDDSEVTLFTRNIIVKIEKFF